MKLTAYEPGDYEACIPDGQVDVELSWEIEDSDRADIVLAFKEFLKNLDFAPTRISFEDECENCGGRMVRGPGFVKGTEAWNCQKVGCYNHPEYGRPEQ